MNPLRLIEGEWTPWTFGLLALRLVILALAAWARARERRGDWGPGFAGMTPTSGYSPADLRGEHAVAIAQPDERRLLGLAAPFVEEAGLLHDRWSLVSAFCDDAWRRRLREVAESWGVVRSNAWRRAVSELEARLAMPASSFDELDIRPLLLAQLAMLLRLGVAARHTSAPRARKRLARAAAPLRELYRDWQSYGDAIIASARTWNGPGSLDLRADTRLLYREGGPWAQPV